MKISNSKSSNRPSPNSSLRSSSSFFSEFLNSLSNRKEVSLIIVKNSEEHDEAINSLKDKGFSGVTNAENLATESVNKSYLFVDNGNLKKAYDFASQYPTGQIEIFDPSSMKSKLMTPDYGSQSVVFVVKESDIFDWQKKGVDLLSQVGLTYQSAK